MAVSAVAVQADDLTLDYPARRRGDGQPAVGGVSFSIGTGEILALLGETGSGKSTLAAAVAGRLGRAGHGLRGGPSITGGSLTVLEQSIRELTPRRRDHLTLRVGYLPQDGGSLLTPRLTAGENIAEPIFSRDRRFDVDEAGIAVATALDAVRLPLSLLSSYPHELSQGQRQRVAIAKALVLDPQVLVADDPTAGVEPTARNAILDIIRALQREKSLSALVVSNSVSEVHRVSDRAAVMHRGTIVGIGSIDDVLDSQEHEYVRGLSLTGGTSRSAEAALT
ncbi:MAG: transporter ATP-binding protein [Glaciihabitans sp.]|nr:transporter ATP-binding protein [Glaciihabitans sp.]